MSSFGNHFTLGFFFSFYTFCQGTVTQTPSTACMGDRITISCILMPPAGQTFISIFPRFLIGNSNTSLSANNINDSVSHPVVDLTRLSAYYNVGSVTMVSGVVTLLSYLTSDEGLRIGCEVPLNTGMELIENIQMIQAVPPSAPNLQSSVTNFNTATCSADISLSWNTPPSDRVVDRYFLFLDGFSLFTTNSNSYIHFTILNINTDYQYSVTAMSCASSIPTSTSTEMSSSFTSMQMITTTVPSNTVSISSCSTLLPTSIILALLFLISLVVNLTLIIIVILLLIRNKQSKSPSKPAQSHPYEYIDLDKMSGNISSPTQQQSPQDYVHMSSISKQDSTQPPTHYANLK